MTEKRNRCFESGVFGCVCQIPPIRASQTRLSERLQQQLPAALVQPASLGFSITASAKGQEPLCVHDALRGCCAPSDPGWAGGLERPWSRPRQAPIWEPSALIWGTFLPSSWTYMSQDFDILAIFSARRHSAAGGCYNNDVRRALEINVSVYSYSLFMLCLFVFVCVLNQLFFGPIQLRDSFRLSGTV